MPRGVLNPRQRQFVRNYVDPDSPTYANGAGSARAAGYNGNNRTLAVAASRLLTDSNIQTHIDTVLAELGADDLVRIGQVAAVIKGEYKTETVTRTEGVDKNGNPIKSKTISTRNPTAAEVVKAAHLVERMRGTFDKNKEVARAAGRTLSKLYSDQRKSFKPNKKAKRASAEPQEG